VQGKVNCYSIAFNRQSLTVAIFSFSVFVSSQYDIIFEELGESCL